MLRLSMEIRNIRHKGLRNLVEKNNPKGMQQDYIEKIIYIMAFLIEIEDIYEMNRAVTGTAD